MIKKIRIELRLKELEALYDYMRAAAEQLEKEKMKALQGEKRTRELHRQMALIIYEKLHRKSGKAYLKGLQANDIIAINLNYPEAYFLELLLLVVHLPFRDYNLANRIIAQLDQQLV